MRYCCPACDGEDVRKLSVVYNSGVSDLNISGNYIGFGRSNWGYIQANGSKVSRLAQSCAPPEKFSSLSFCGVIIFAVAWCPLAELGTKVVLGAIILAFILVEIIFVTLLAVLRIRNFAFFNNPLLDWLWKDITWKAELSIPIVLALTGWILVLMWQYNRSTWVQEYRKWQSSFMCLQCGTKFLVC